MNEGMNPDISDQCSDRGGDGGVDGGAGFLVVFVVLVVVVVVVESGQYGRSGRLGRLVGVAGSNDDNGYDDDGDRVVDNDEDDEKQRPITPDNCPCLLLYLQMRATTKVENILLVKATATTATTGKTRQPTPNQS